MAATWCAEGATHACHRGWPQRGACRLANKPPPCGLASHRHSTFLTQTRAPERSGTSHAALCSTRAHRRIAVAAGGAGGIGGASSSGAHRGDPGWQRTPTPRSSDAPHRPGTSSPGRPVEGAHPSVPQRHSHPHPRATTQPTVAPFEESERDLQPGLQPSHPQIAPPAITGWQRRRDPLRWIEENDGDGDSGLLPAWRACRTQVLVHRQSLVGAQQSLALTHPGFQVYWIVIWQVNSQQPFTWSVQRSGEEPSNGLPHMSVSSRCQWSVFYQSVFCVRNSMLDPRSVLSLASVSRLTSHSQRTANSVTVPPPPFPITAAVGLCLEPPPPALPACMAWSRLPPGAGAIIWGPQLDLPARHPVYLSYFHKSLVVFLSPYTRLSIH